MRTIEVIDHMQQSRGRYHRTEGSNSRRSSRSGRRRMDDLVLSEGDDNASVSSSSSSVVGRGGGIRDDDDDDASVSTLGAGEDLELGLERELSRRAFRKRAKFCAAFAVFLVLSLAVIGRRHGGVGGFSLFAPARAGGGGDDDPDEEIDVTTDAGGGVLEKEEEEEEEVAIPAVPPPPPPPSEEKNDDDASSAPSYYQNGPAAPPFQICAPPMERDRLPLQEGYAVFHMGEFRTVPEADDDVAEGDVYDANSWEYTLSDMDVSADASIIAVGMGDYTASVGATNAGANDEEWSVGMVRVFAWSCADREWRRLGQDLLGQNEMEMFGHRVSSSGDGRVLAVSAPQGSSIDGSTGFCEVYFLNEDAGRWELLGSRIDSLDKAKSDYYMLGHAIDVSDKGDTLAVLAIADGGDREEDDGNPSYVTRVFDYDYHRKEWTRKGHDLVVEDVAYASGSTEYDPQVSLSDDGDRLIVTDPRMGVVKYRFHFGYNKWKQEGSRTPTWNDDEDNEYWIESLDLDDKGELVAFSAFEEDDEDNAVMSVKFVDFADGNPLDVYANDFRGWRVGLSVAVSDMGNVAAVVASKIDIDDANWWVDYDYGDDVVGALTVVAKLGGDGDDDDGAWSVVGEGTEAESLGVPGSVVSLSGDGRIAAVGHEDVVSLYGISLDRGGAAGAGAEEADTPDEQGDSEEEEGDGTGGATVALSTMVLDTLDSCDLDDAGSITIDDLPQMKEGEDQHTLSLALSADGSVVAVGVDSFDGEDRGLVRAFAWSCEEGGYVRLGEDLLGTAEFDGFGQSVDLSADGRTLAVGANQPPPGKTGYVDVYRLGEGSWEAAGDRIEEQLPEDVADVGREVRLSDDGRTIMILGSIIMDGGDYDSSFIRVLRADDRGEWIALGDDILSSVDYDDYGTDAHATLSGDGNTVVVTGSYSQFLAKMYQFDQDASSWTETVIPPLDSCANDYSLVGSAELDYSYECYFTGEDIAINSAATFLAIAGTSYDTSEGDFGTVRVLTKNSTTGNFTLSEDPINYTTDYYVSSVDISDDGQHLAVGINDHNDDLDDQGAMFVTQKTGIWTGVGKVDGIGEADLLGARVRITSNGRLAAASSRKGYVSFFVTG